MSSNYNATVWAAPDEYGYIISWMNRRWWSKSELKSECAVGPPSVKGASSQSKRKYKQGILLYPRGSEMVSSINDSDLLSLMVTSINVSYECYYLLKVTSNNVSTQLCPLGINYYQGLIQHFLPAWIVVFDRKISTPFYSLFELKFAFTIVEPISQSIP